MRITAALAWYAESSRFLERCVLSLHGLVDHVVAVDGAWQHFPTGGLLLASASEQRAIRRAAYNISASVEIHAPLGVWDSQVHKRDMLMRWAGDRTDWIFVIDADEWISRCDTETVRAELAAAEVNVAAVEVTNLHQGEELPGYHPQGALKRRFYRPGTTVEIVHSGYVYDGRQILTGEPTLDLAGQLEISHDICNRGHDRNERARGYREARDREGVEMWVPIGAIA